MTEMADIVKGWGIYLETVEITDVKILSSSLFKDMQCEFRENQNFEATVKRMDVEHDIQVDKSNHKFTTDKRHQDTHEKKSIDDSARTIVMKDQEYV